MHRSFTLVYIIIVLVTYLLSEIAANLSSRLRARARARAWGARHERIEILPGKINGTHALYSMPRAARDRLFKQCISGGLVPFWNSAMQPSPTLLLFFYTANRHPTCTRAQNSLMICVRWVWRASVRLNYANICRHNWWCWYPNYSVKTECERVKERARDRQLLMILTLVFELEMCLYARCARALQWTECSDTVHTL